MASGGMYRVNFSFVDCAINRRGGKSILRVSVVDERRKKKNMFQAKQLKDRKYFFPQAMLFGFSYSILYDKDRYMLIVVHVTRMLIPAST